MADNTDNGRATEASGEANRKGTFSRSLIAVIIGILGSVLIWVATPFNNYVVRSVYISDSYLPFGAFFVLLLLILIVNPLLRLLAPRISLTGRQLSLILGILLMASVIPANGLMRYLPYQLVEAVLQVQKDSRLAEAYEHMDLPTHLFPAPMGFGVDAPTATYFRAELPLGESIPWADWVGPLLSWGSLLALIWLMMFGLSLIVLPQWRNNERLAFPLITIQEALIEEPEQGRLMPPLLRQKSFWGGVIGVFVIYLLFGGNVYFPESVPAIPLKYNISNIFTEDPLRHLPSYLKSFRVYFMFLGVAFFAPTRITFSVWFFAVAYGLYQVYGMAYDPPYNKWSVLHHQMGAMVALAIAIVWLGRAHWKHVFGLLGRKSSNAEDRRDREAGWMFILGGVGILCWLWLYGGLPLGWALFLVVFVFMAGILIARVVAETGMPFVDLGTQSSLPLIKLVPLSWVTPVVVFFSTVIAMLMAKGSRVAPSAMATHALGFEKNSKPGRQTRLAMLFLSIMLLGFLVSGAAHLLAAYNFSASLDGVMNPINKYGPYEFNGMNNNLKNWTSTGEVKGESKNWKQHTVAGFVMGGGLMYLCMTMPRWPIHPIGIIIMRTYTFQTAWFSIFLGWLIKTLILRYGGARVFRKAQPIFVGLVVGEIMAGLFWSIVPGILAALGKSYHAVEVIPY
ncbi:MAG: DUF6785 family protein [Candidatus Sumerlaeia bacterium]